MGRLRSPILAISRINFQPIPKGVTSRVTISQIAKLKEWRPLYAITNTGAVVTDGSLGRKGPRMNYSSSVGMALYQLRVITAEEAKASDDYVALCKFKDQADACREQFVDLARILGVALTSDQIMTARKGTKEYQNRRDKLNERINAINKARMVLDQDAADLAQSAAERDATLSHAPSTTMVYPVRADARNSTAVPIGALKLGSRFKYMPKQQIRTVIEHSPHGITTAQVLSARVRWEKARKIAKKAAITSKARMVREQDGAERTVKKIAILGQGHVGTKSAKPSWATVLATTKPATIVGHSKVTVTSVKIVDKAAKSKATDKIAAAKTAAAK